MITALALWKLFLAFLVHLEALCTVVGIFAIAIPLLDQGVRRLQARWPNSRFINVLDKILFGSGNALINIGLALDKMLALRRSLRP